MPSVGLKGVVRVSEELKPLDPTIVALEAEFKELEFQKKGNGWIVEWYMKKMSALDSLESAVKARHAEIKKDIANERNHLEYKWGQVMQQESKKLLAKENKKKSVKLLTGTIGTRHTDKRLAITDQQKLIVWMCGQSAVKPAEAVSKLDIPLAVQGLNKMDLLASVKEVKVTPFRDYFEETGEIPPGCEIVPATDKFYAKPVVMELGGGKDD